MKKSKLLLSLLIPLLFLVNSDLKVNKEEKQDALPVTMNLNNSNIMPLAIHSNGKYEVPLTLDLSMGADAFSKTAIVEKLDDHYYMTFTQVDSSNLADMKLLSEGKHGEIVRVDGNKKSYTYTVSEEELSKPFKFSVVVTVMNKLVSFEMKLNLNNALYKGDTIDDLGERPALYIPEIETNVSDIELEKGSIYVLPKASAVLNNKNIEVSKKVTLNDEEVEIKDNKIILSSLGEYKVTYTAESSEYKTSLGNNTKSVVSFVITSKVGASALGKLEDSNNVLEEGSQLQTSLLTSGKTFDLAKETMKKIADNYQVFDLVLYSKEGNVIDLKDNVSIYLRADDYFNRNKINLYYMDKEGNLTSVDIENYGRYIKCDTNKMGTYIVCVPGVAFNMPIWGYALIGVGALLVIIGIVVTIIIIKKKHK